MENVLLTVLLINALLLIGIVLLQRSEGGGLGMGGGGGGAMSGRSAASAMATLTWLFGAAFMACSVALTVVAAGSSSGASVVARLGAQPAAVETPALPTGSDLLPPPAGDAPATPPRVD
jgi:preprotein translocase subunit SecG